MAIVEKVLGKSGRDQLFVNASILAGGSMTERAVDKCCSDSPLRLERAPGWHPSTLPMSRIPNTSGMSPTGLT
jgi:hypothetical protein